MISTKSRFVERSRSRNGSHTVNGKTGTANRRRRRHIITLGLSIVALIIAGLYVLPWAHYRLGHVVTHEAIVVGDVTPIGARVDGQLKRLEVEPGQWVNRGGVLAHFEDQHLRARVDESSANLELAVAEHTAQAAYVDQQRTLRNVQLERAKADVELAAAKITEAESQRPRWEREFGRTERLLPAKIVSETEMDRVRANRDATWASIAAAKAQHRAAEVEYERAKVELEGLAVQEAQLEILASKIEVARRELATAEVDLEAALIRAPQDGRVVKMMVGPGASVKVGQPILTFWNSERVLVEARVQETALSQIEVGTPVDVTLPAFRGKVFAGRVEAICPVSNEIEEAGSRSTSPLLPHTTNFCVWVRLDDVDRPLVPGLSVVVGIKRR